MRPLFFDFPLDKKTYEIDDQMMFGPTYLVAPQMYEKLNFRNVYLPDKNIFWKYWFNETLVLQGGQIYNISTPLDEFPLFIKT